MSSTNDDIINLGFITTLDEVIEKEFVGKEVIDPITNLSLGIREGTLDSLAQDIANANNNFGKNYNLSCIIVNDDKENVLSHWNNKEGFDPSFIINKKENKTLKDITHIIPSSIWRKIPIPSKGSSNRQEIIDKRKKIKQEYEENIVNVLNKSKVDILISNSYTNIIGTVLLSAYENRIINIHPAITHSKNPCRLPGITPTRDAYTRAKHGFVIIDDKKSVSICGEESIKEYKGEQRKVVLFSEEYRYSHGVTVHVVTKGVDEGPPILTKEYDLRDYFNINNSDPNKPLLTEERIRDYNYSLKPSVLKMAINEYITRDKVKEYIKEGRKNHC